MHACRSSEAQRFLPYALAIALLCAFPIGCGTSPVPSADAARSRPGYDASKMPPVTSPVVQADGDHSDFDKAQPATLPLQGDITIEGRISHKGDIVFYALGPAAVGDRITIDVAGKDGLNTVAALFDGNGEVIDVNDDRAYYIGQIDPYISAIVRVDTDNLFIGVAVSTASYFASNSGRFDSGNFTIHVIRQINQTLPNARQQVVYINFAGGNTVQIAQEAAEQMRPFSAESISSRLAGQTSYII
jgi:hypothetical protein